MDDVRRSRLQHVPRIGKALGDSKTFSQLFGHERFLIAQCYNLAIRNPADGLYMLIGDFAATDYRDTEHSFQRSESEVRDQTTGSDDFKMKEVGAFIMVPSIAPTSRHFSVKIL